MPKSNGQLGILQRLVGNVSPAIDDALIPRFAAKLVTTALAGTPVVLINGPRPCGKTSLVQRFATNGRQYISPDDETADRGAVIMARDTTKFWLQMDFTY